MLMPPHPHKAKKEPASRLIMKTMRKRMPHSHVMNSLEVCKALMPVIVVALTALVLGYDGGMMSGAIGPIKEEFELTSFQEGLVVGICNLVAGLGALTGSNVIDYLGRVNGFAVTGMTLLTGALMLGLAPGYYTFLLGRIICGVGIGWAFVVSPIYGAELAPPSIRGAIVSITEIIIAGGVLLGYASALLLQIPGMPVSVGWRLVCGLAGAPVFVALLFWPVLPESPRWLVQAGRREEAARTLYKLGAVDNEQELAEELAAIDQALALETDQASWKAIICPTKVVRKMLVAGAGPAFYSQICGSEALIYYTPMILLYFGVTSRAVGNEAAVAVGMGKFVGTLAGASILDSMGRRPAMIVSTSGLFACLVLLLSTTDLKMPILGIGLLVTYLFFMEVGVAPGGFVLGSEVYPPSIRAKGLSVGMIISRVVSGVVALVFPTFVEMMGMKATLGMFAVFTLTGIFWACLLVPETMGLTLEDAAALFEDPVAEES